MPRGGRRPAAGRPRGASNYSTRARLEVAAAGGELPVDYMLRVMRDENAPDRRRDRMARSAAAYLHARLERSSVDEDEQEEGESAPSSNTEAADGAGAPHPGEAVGNGAS